MSDPTPNSSYFKIFSKNLILYYGFHFLKQRKLKDYFKIYKDYDDFPTYVDMLNAPMKYAKDIEKDEDYYYLEELKSKISNAEQAKIDNFFRNFTFENFIEFECINYLLFLFIEMESYLFKCFKFLLLKNPTILNNATITLKKIIKKKGNIEFIFDEIAEKKIHNKFYKSYTEIFNYAKKILGIKHNIPDRAIDLLNYFKQIRNLFAHSDGTISQIFLSRIKHLGFKYKIYKLGEKFKLNEEIIYDINKLIHDIALIFDKSLIKAYPELGN